MDGCGGSSGSVVPARESVRRSHQSSLGSAARSPLATRSDPPHPLNPPHPQEASVLDAYERARTRRTSISGCGEQLGAEHAERTWEHAERIGPDRGATQASMPTPKSFLLRCGWRGAVRASSTSTPKSVLRALGSSSALSASICCRSSVRECARGSAVKAVEERSENPGRFSARALRGHGGEAPSARHVDRARPVRVPLPGDNLP